MTEPFDLAIVGGGPAGQAAAAVAVAAGLRVVMLDEQARMGGQILRQPPAAMRVATWLPGRSYRALKRHLAAAEALALDWRGRTSVVGALPPAHDGAPFTLLAAPVDGTGGARIAARHLLVATGCYDLPVPLPGWTLPGVMAAGGIQAFVKSQQIVPGTRFVLAGSHPLQLVLAAQIVRAGGTVAAVLFARGAGAMAAPFLRRPLVALRHGSILLDGLAAYAGLRRRGVPVHFGAGLAAIEGVDEVAGVRLDDGTVIACDRVGLCYGFLPQADLPRSLGAGADWVEPAGGWATRTDAWQQSDVAGLYVAGETTGVAGAAAAIEKGHIAGLGILRAAGRLSEAEATRAAAPARRRLAHLERFAGLLAAAAAPRFPEPDPDTILCRCEDVRRDAVEAALAGTAAPSNASAVKLVSRAGMGVCQGRGCEAAVVRLAAARLGVTPAVIGGFTPRFPIRPVSIGQLLE